MIMKVSVITLLYAFLLSLPVMAQEKPMGRKVSDYTTGPKLGGYVIAKYALTDRNGENSNSGLSQRMARLYADGTILTDSGTGYSCR